MRFDRGLIRSDCKINVERVLMEREKVDGGRKVLWMWMWMWEEERRWRNVGEGGVYDRAKTIRLQRTGGGHCLDAASEAWTRASLAGTELAERHQPPCQMRLLLLRIRGVGRVKEHSESTKHHPQ